MLRSGKKELFGNDRKNNRKMHCDQSDALEMPINILKYLSKSIFLLFHSPNSTFTFQNRMILNTKFMNFLIYPFNKALFLEY